MSAYTHQFSRETLIDVAKCVHEHMEPDTAPHYVDGMIQIIAALQAYPLGSESVAKAAVYWIMADLAERRGFAELFESMNMSAVRDSLVAKLTQHVAGPTYPFGAPHNAAPQLKPSDLEFETS